MKFDSDWKESENSALYFDHSAYFDSTDLKSTTTSICSVALSFYMY